MAEGMGFILLGSVMIVSAPIGHYHASWKSPWHVAGWGCVCLMLGTFALALDLLR